LISLVALNGLRISEALGADIEDLAVERGHRTLRILRKGGKSATIPLAPRTARAIDLVVGERLGGPLFLAVTGGWLDRHAAARIVRRLARQARHRQTDRPPLAPARLHYRCPTDAGVPLRDVQEAVSHADPRTTMRYDRARQSLDRHATYIVAAFIAGAAR
jgi:integrase/recombinase XerD